MAFPADKGSDLTKKSNTRIYFDPKLTNLKRLWEGSMFI